MHPPSELRTAIESALQGRARLVERVSAGWRMEIANGSHVEASARLVDEVWLELTAPVPALPFDYNGERGWQLLRLNARLDGCARAALRADGGLDIRGEIFVAGATDGSFPGLEPPDDEGPVDEPRTLDERVAELVADVCIAHGSAVTLDCDSPSATEQDTGLAAGECDEFMRTCERTGWHVGSRSARGVEIALDAGTTSYQALVSRDRASRLRVVVLLSDGPVKSESSRAAIATLLLGAGTSIRTVKGVAFARGNIEFAGIGAACSRQPHTEAALDRVLSALHVACSRLGREVRALQNDDLASAFLAVRSPPASQAPSFVNHAPELEDTPCLQLP